MNARRAHTKSKNGCLQCKAGKVKCDEKIPCSRCVRRGDECSRAQPNSSEASVTSASSTPDTTSSSHTRPRDEDSYTLVDLQLFHRFSTVTCRYLANPNNESPWLDKVPALGTKHAFLMHEMMAVAAIDIGINVADTQDAVTTYLELARQHHTQALAGLMPAIAAHRADLVMPIWSCNALFVPYYFATTADVGSLILTEDPPGPAEWMLPLRGAVTLFRQYEEVLLSGPMAMHIRPYQTRIMIDGVTPPSSNPSEEHVMRMTAQLTLQLDEVTDEATRTTMAEVLRLLRQCFEISDRGDLISYKTASLTFCAAMPGAFFEMLGRKESMALVVMAFWCVLLHRAEGGNWWMKFRKVKNMLSFIAGLLGPKDEMLIKWPLEVVCPAEE
ncbi:hypothetical protein M406DRAFT_326195 [Cryphonectria parasitica EP155]|uniref:Zn(2)-C6 fungal-type domain-containing protein n=1 Tax=Cryphonectria parasitica (strain ATCC 38755 / EP155) TaxID=660469 RepID=A0A9P4YCY3_CRYP1|nr:uncharacterized protein M406DRAFT_326195 [Cryphonectria parasitica EP155]KAF3770771.1 hypothetical protein M406DRAFT_326195 [Cryphonectria parasitica EP155]